MTIIQYSELKVGDWVLWSECPVGINCTFPFQIVDICIETGTAALDMWSGRRPFLRDLKLHVFENVKTPLGNTGSNCQSLAGGSELVPARSALEQGAKPQSESLAGDLKFAERLTCRLHWLQGTVRFVDEPDFTELIKSLLKLFEDEGTFDDGVRGRGKKFLNSGSSTKGIIYAWNNPTEDSQGEGWISISGSVLDSVTVSRLKDVCLLLAAAEFKATRIDSAVDDYSKSISFEQIIEIARAGNFAGFRHKASGDKAPSYDFHTSPYVVNERVQESTTIYFRGKGSDKQFYYYNKSAQSGGEIDAYRFESRHSDEQADIRFKFLCKAFQERELVDCQKIIGGFCLGAIDFIDRSIGDRLSRHPRFEWWQELIDALDSIRLPVIRPIPCLERSLAWINRQWVSTMASLQEVVGFEDTFNYFIRLIEEGYERLQSRHIAVINRAKAENFSINKYLLYAS